MKKWMLALVPAMAISSVSAGMVERENSWVIPDLLFLDRDGDGIADQNDACAGTATGKIVGADGCELPVARMGDNQLNINFDFNQAVVKPQYMDQLQEFADILKANEGVRVELSGHADLIGSDSYNQALSERRAQAVAAVLINKFEVPSIQLDIVGYSEDQPLVAGDSEEQRALNRRVQAELVNFNQNEQFLKTSGSE